MSTVIAPWCLATPARIRHLYCVEIEGTGTVPSTLPSRVPKCDDGGCYTIGTRTAVERMYQGENKHFLKNNYLDFCILLKDRLYVCASFHFSRVASR